MSKGMWEGQPLESFSKDELIDIVLAMGKMQSEQQERAVRDRDILLGMVQSCRSAPSWRVALTFVLIGLALRFFVHAS